MPDGEIPPERMVDPQAATGRSRDPARTPMQWDPSPNAGFSPPGRRALAAGGGRPRAAQRRGRRTPTRARAVAVPAPHRAAPRAPRPAARLAAPARRGRPRTLAYVREHDGERLLVALHFGAEPVTADLADAGAGRGERPALHRARSRRRGGPRRARAAPARRASWSRCPSGELRERLKPVAAPAKASATTP